MSRANQTVLWRDSFMSHANQSDVTFEFISQKKFKINEIKKSITFLHNKLPLYPRPLVIPRLGAYPGKAKMSRVRPGPGVLPLRAGLASPLRLLDAAPVSTACRMHTPRRVGSTLQNMTHLTAYAACHMHASPLAFNAVPCRCM
jgi:hypothetical protein